MKKRKIYFGIIILIIISSIFILNRDWKKGSAENFYQLNSRFFDSYSLQQEFYSNTKNLFVKDTIYCSVNENLQEKVNQAIGKTLILDEGIHKSYVLKLPSNIKIVIPKNTSIKLADDFVIDQSAYGDAVGDAVIQCWGTEDKLLENIIIELNGTIDGNKSIHPYSKGGIEGVDFKWVKNSYIYGAGAITNVNGDGLDIDVSNNCYFEGITLSNNDGGGIHFGSPRPIKTSFNNLVVGCKAVKNGYLSKRYGFDHSWPNIDGVTYFNCIATDNFLNWGVEGTGAVLLNCFSNYTDTIQKTDLYKEALFFDLNNTPIPSFKETNNSNDYSFREEINKTGYYFVVSTKSSMSGDRYNFYINGIEKNKIKIDSQAQNKSTSVGVYFFHEKDIVELKSDTDSTIKITPIVPYDSFYLYNYKFKILSWRVKSAVKSFIYEVYSIFK